MRLAWLLPISTAVVGCSEDSCFVAGTRVRCLDGDRPIEDLAVSDSVLAFDVVEGRTIVGRVAAIHRALVSEVRTIVAGSVRMRGVTRAHPIYEAGRRAFVPASELRVGDRLLVDGNEAVVSSIVAHELAEPRIAVFNLTVADAPPTFIADGVVVHNKSSVIDCAQLEPRIRVEAALTTPCVGDRFPVRALRGPTYCTHGDALPAVFATSNPDLLVVESGNHDPATAIARGAGTVTLTALHDGDAGSVEITVRACEPPPDAGSGD